MSAKNRGHLKIVKPKAEPLAPIEHPVLRRKRVTPNGLAKYTKALLAALAPHMVPEAFQCLRKAMSEGDINAAVHTLKSFEVLKSPGMSIQQVNTNTAQSETVRSVKNFDSLMRDRAVEKRITFDVTPMVSEAADAINKLPPIEAKEEEAEE
jgi:hypothetical protein